MYDLVIRAGTIVDGSGSKKYVGDLAVTNGKIIDIGTHLGTGKLEFNADGALVTPGWVDIHTHYDGQATWDPYLSPSLAHGVTTVVMGNCGVGFAPVKQNSRDWLISVMEGVEDIPGTVLSEGIQWNWESFPEYLAALESQPHAQDIGTQISHSALRAYVMGERSITHEEATPKDIKEMCRLVQEGLNAGALGFSTTRTLIHKYKGHKYPPGTFASLDEVMGIAEAIGAVGHGVFQMTSNHTQMPTEIPWLRTIAEKNRIPVLFALVQTDETPDTWKSLLHELDLAESSDIPLYGAVAGRPAGILMSWQGSVHPFIAHELWRSMEGLSWSDKLTRLRDPGFRQALTSEEAMAAALKYNSRLAYLTKSYQKMYALGSPPEYEPMPESSIASIAHSTGRRPLDLAYDILMSEDGQGIIYFPSFNYAYDNLNQLYAQLQHPRTINSLADGGAHCGYICDVSMPTYMLTHWVRDRTRGPKLPLELIVRRQTYDTSLIYGLGDRGLLKPGMLADINIIDWQKLKLLSPYVAFDLPAGGRRLMQGAEGYVATFKRGLKVMAESNPTGVLGGRLIRGPQRISQ